MLVLLRGEGDKEKMRMWGWECSECVELSKWVLSIACQSKKQYSLVVFIVAVWSTDKIFSL